MAKYSEHLRLTEVDYLPVHPPEHHLQTLRTTTEGCDHIPGSSRGKLGRVTNLDFRGLIFVFFF